MEQNAKKYPVELSGNNATKYNKEMIPDNIHKEHILRAIEEIDKQGIRPGDNPPPMISNIMAISILQSSLFQ